MLCSRINGLHQVCSVCVIPREAGEEEQYLNWKGGGLMSSCKTYQGQMDTEARCDLGAKWTNKENKRLNFWINGVEVITYRKNDQKETPQLTLLTQ